MAVMMPPALPTDRPTDRPTVLPTGLPKVVPGLILAGGRARRMGGIDKALVLLGGRPLMAHVAARLAPQCAPLALSANGDPRRFDGAGLAAGAPVLPDAPPDGVEPFAGPLAGLLAGLDWAAAAGLPCVVTAAADTPFLPADLVARLSDGDGPAVAASSGPDGRLRRHPTFGLWPVALRDDLRAALTAGERKLGLWAERQGARIVPFPAEDGDPFFNVNTPEDLAQAEAMLAARR
jgi:molybdopterin-guanine dinucleotide biosynthesis protein A